MLFYCVVLNDSTKSYNKEGAATMTVILNDRPREQVKEEVIDILVHNFSHGVISSEAFERRLDVVIAAESNAEMMAEVDDLDVTPDAMIKQNREKHFSVNYSPEAVEDEDYIVNIMSGSDRSGHWVVPNRLNLISIMGGSTIDFSDAQFGSANVTIRSLAIMGGDTIYVPENVNVVCKVFCLMGGISNRAPSIADRNAPTITITGFALMGGSTIKVKTTIKEKFVAFANQMKTTFNQNR